MTESPLIRALGGTTLALGLVITAAPGVSAEERPAVAGGAEQLEAMERDLGLTSAEAADLLTQEERARALERELQRSIGDAFGGAVFDTESGDLTVSVTEEDAVEEVREAGADAEVVTYGEDTLNGIVAKLNDHEARAGDAVTGWYADLESDSVVVTALSGDKKAAEEFLTDAEVTSEAVRIEQTTEEPETLADIIGGDAYYIGSGRCSVGFAVQGGFVTAGHCGGTGTTTSSPDGTFQGSVFPNRDMGYVATTSGWTPRPLVDDHSGGTVTVAGSQEAGVGSSVCRSGSTTGWHCGTIEAKNQTVRYSEGTVYGLTRTSVCAEPGDSGGSFIAGDQAQGVTSGGSGNCLFGGTTYFQPVNPILNQWNLTLTTG